MKKLLLSFISAFVIFTLSAQVAEDFSDYTVGGKLAQQANAMGRMYWTTWSQAPGGPEDGKIGEKDDNKVYAPTYGVDQVLKLGKKTSGKWELSLKLFVPTGKDAYFNVMGLFVGNGNDDLWAMQFAWATDVSSSPVYTPGILKLYAGQAQYLSFNFSHDTWLNIKIIMNLDADHVDFYLNDALLHSWQYTLGTFGEGCPKVIDVMDIFPSSNTNLSVFYIDDIVFKDANAPDCNPATNLKVEYTADCKASLTWDAPADFKYNIYRDGTLVKENHTTTSYTDEGFVTYSQHTWDVKVVCAADLLSDPVSATLPACSCDPVTEPSATVTPVAATIIWTSVTGAQGYKIYRGEQLLGTVTTTTFTEEGEFVPDDTYTWEIVTVCDGKESSAVPVSAICIGINEFAFNFSIVPNPAENNITITSLNDFNKIDVLNFLGQTIMTQTVSGRTATLDVANLHHGIYFVRIISENGVSTKKFVKK